MHRAPFTQGLLAHSSSAESRIKKTLDKLLELELKKKKNLLDLCNEIKLVTQVHHIFFISWSQLLQRGHNIAGISNSILPACPRGGEAGVRRGGQPELAQWDEKKGNRSTALQESHF